MMNPPLQLAGVVTWPEALAASYRERGWWAGVPFGVLIDRWAEVQGDRPAVSAGAQTLSYGDLATRSRTLAAHLRTLGIKRGDRVVVQLPNEIGFCDLTLALLRIGAPPVLALPAHREHELGYLLDQAGAIALAVPAEWRGHDHLAMAVGLGEGRAIRHLLVSGDCGAESSAIGLDELAELPAADLDLDDSPSSGDVALFLLSGGTTGLPKLIPRTHDDYIYNARASAEVCDFHETTVYLATLPVAHNFPLACPGILGTWDAGGRVVLGEDPAPEAAFAIIERERVTATALVPALALRWLDSPERDRFDLSSLALLQVGGARLPAEAARRLEAELDVHVQQVFGMAEGLLNYTRLDDSLDVRAETQGRPLSPGDEIRIVNPKGDSVPPGQTGELLTRGPYTLRGYYRAGEHNAQAFTADGFYRTGDLVELHPSGNLIVRGRAKDVINRAGEKISAEEVETVVLTHGDVVQAAAVAMPDPDLGERTCVYVIPREGHSLTLEDLCRHLVEECRIARYKHPERLELVGDLPLTKMGKVDKQALRDDVTARLRGYTGACKWAR